MCQELILKYSNMTPDLMMGMPLTEEVMNAIRDKLRDEIMDEVRTEFHEQIAQLETEVDSSTDFESEAEAWEDDATDLYHAIEKALTEDWESAKVTLQRALRDSDVPG